MSLKVYFDRTLIDEQYYTGLNNNNELFNESFKLGSTPCNTYKLRIAKEGVTTQPSTIELAEETNMFANLNIDNIEEKDYEYVYTLTDRMIDLNFNYDASAIFSNGSAKLLDIVQDICTKAGILLGTTDFRGYNKDISWYDNTRTAREYIGYVAELNGGFARIENNTLYFIKQKTTSKATISIDDCENFNIGERHLITRVVYELGALKWEYGNNTGNTLYLNNDNVYITEQSEVEAIYNDIKDFEYYSFNTSNCPIDYDIKAGDIITFTDGTNNYPTIAQYDLEYYGGWIGGYNLDVNTERQQETQIIGTKENIKNLRIIVDRDANTITQVVEEVGEQNTKISQVQQSVNELNSKIQDIADITTQGETEFASLNLSDINESEPIEIKVRPTTQNISYLYPRNTLYPSDTLYMPNRIIRFTNTSTNEVFDYELPDDLLTTGAVYDEFYLGYDQQVCQVTKRCGYNADGTVYALSQEQINTYTYPTIELTEGNYTIELAGYSNGYLNVRLMAKNIYTSQFYTKAETNSIISQTSQDINLSVDTKLSNYSTTTQMNSAISLSSTNILSTVSETYATKTTTNSLSTRINQTAKTIELTATDNQTSAGITIKLKNEDGTQIDSKSANITMSGLVKFTDLSNSGSTTINGANITTGTIKSSNYSSGSTGTSINLSTGAIDTKSFKVDSSGNITATGGKIGNFTIDNYTLIGGSGTSQVGLCSTSGQGYYAIWAGSSTSTSAPFRVGHYGELYASNATISGNISASTISGSTISGNTISGGTISGTTISGTTITASNVSFSPNSSRLGSFTIYSNQLYSSNSYGAIGISSYRNGQPMFFVEDSSGDNWATMSPSGFLNGSQEKIKKNFDKLINGLDIVMNTDIYKYNLKNQKDGDKKHIGLVIGDKYNYSTEITDEKNESVNLYSMISVAYKAIQEQQEQIEELKKEIEKLKEGK